MLFADDPMGWPAAFAIAVFCVCAAWLVHSVSKFYRWVPPGEECPEDDRLRNAQGDAMLCDAFWQLSDKDGDLVTRGERVAFHEHYDECKPCAVRFDREVREALGRLSDEEIAASVMAGVKDALELKLAADPEAR